MMRSSASALPRPLRVLHCPWNIAGLPVQQARSERKLGLVSRSIIWSADKFGFGADEVLLRGDERLRDIEAVRWNLLRRAVRDFDVVHFNFGQTILEPDVQPDISAGFQRSVVDGVWQIYCRLVWMNDLPILRAFGKIIAMTYQGDDARQSDFSKKNFAINIANKVDVSYYPPGSDERKRRAISKVGRYADLIYALNPDLLHVLPKTAKFLPYGNIDLAEWLPAPAQNQKPVVLHAPTSRSAKGTEFIISAVDRIKRDGIEFEFSLIENMTNAEARKQYARADLLIDQLNAGWYGGLAVELMALQKPVICYLRKDDLGFIPSGMRADLPLIQAEPGTIYDVLKNCLTTGREKLADIGRRSRTYVEKWHEPGIVAASVVNDYQAVQQRRARS